MSVLCYRVQMEMMALTELEAQLENPYETYALAIIIV